MWTPTSSLLSLTSAGTLHLWRAYAVFRSRSRQFEIHLLLESVHFGDLHRDFVAQADHAAAAAADQLVALRVKYKKIILD